MGRDDEVTADSPQLWAEFADPADPDQRLRVDLSWLTSSWSCIFGQGCPGVYADRPDDGCCTHGAHFSDRSDLARVRQVVERLGPDEWQMHDLGQDLNWAVADPHEPSETTTALVEGACIFLNRPGFPAGPGCALHQHALGSGELPHTTKPDVCWQLPIKRSYRSVTRADESAYTEVTLEAFDRGSWGPGGHDFDWYCTAAVSAHQGAEPVYRSMRPELIELIGKPAYDVLEKMGDEVLSTRQSAAIGGPPQAEGRRSLPLFVHPATHAAGLDPKAEPLQDRQPG